MRASLHNVEYTYDEYIWFEASSNAKNEYLDGQIYAMAGGTRDHAALSSWLITLSNLQLRDGPCNVYGSDMRIRTRSGLTTYPDVSVVCGPEEYDATDQLAFTNPTILFEVLSNSTEKYDTTEKFEHYKTLPSLRQYVLVSHRERSIDVWTREADGTWQKTTTREGEIAELVLGMRLDVRELYDAAGVLPTRT